MSSAVCRVMSYRDGSTTCPCFLGDKFPIDGKLSERVTRENFVPSREVVIVSLVVATITMFSTVAWWLNKVKSTLIDDQQNGQVKSPLLGNRQISINFKGKKNNFPNLQGGLGGSSLSRLDSILIGGDLRCQDLLKKNLPQEWIVEGMNSKLEIQNLHQEGREALRLEVKNLRNIRGQLEKENKNQKKALETQEKQSLAIKKAYEEIKIEKNNLQQKVANQRQRNVTMQEKLNKLEEEAKQATKKIEELNKKIEEKIKAKLRLENVNKNLSEKIEELKAEIQQKIEKNNTEIKELQKRIEQLKVENWTLGQETQNIINDLENKIKILNNEKLELKESNRQKILGLEKARNDYKIIADRHQNVIEILQQTKQQEKVKLQEQYDKLGKEKDEEIQFLNSEVTQLKEKNQDTIIQLQKEHAQNQIFGQRIQQKEFAMLLLERKISNELQKDPETVDFEKSVRQLEKQHETHEQVHLREKIQEEIKELKSFNKDMLQQKKIADDPHIPDNIPDNAEITVKLEEKDQQRSKIDRSLQNLNKLFLRALQLERCGCVPLPEQLLKQLKEISALYTHQALLDREIASLLKRQNQALGAGGGQELTRDWEELFLSVNMRLKEVQDTLKEMEWRDDPRSKSLTENLRRQEWSLIKQGTRLINRVTGGQGVLNKEQQQELFKQVDFGSRSDREQKILERQPFSSRFGIVQAKVSHMLNEQQQAEQAEYAQKFAEDIQKYKEGQWQRELEAEQKRATEKALVKQLTEEFKIFSTDPEKFIKDLEQQEKSVYSVYIELTQQHQALKTLKEMQSALTEVELKLAKMKQAMFKEKFHLLERMQQAPLLEEFSKYFKRLCAQSWNLQSYLNNEKKGLEIRIKQTEPLEADVLVYTEGTTLFPDKGRVEGAPGS